MVKKTSALRFSVWVEINFPVEKKTHQKDKHWFRMWFPTVNVFKYYMCYTHIRNVTINYPLEIATLPKHYP